MNQPAGCRVRITSLDFIRGISVLAMLVANVPWHVGDSMSRVHHADASSVLAWLNMYLVFDQRFMPLFAMLFGASILLLAGDAGRTPRFSAYFLRRMIALLLIGVLHAYLLWPGDILITYALCGPVLLLCMHAPVRRLLSVGIALVLLDFAFAEWPELYESTIEKVLFSWWVDIGDPPSTISQAYAGSYSDLFAYNAWRNQFLQWTALPYFRVWYALGFMLIGMALFRLGILQGQRSQIFYRKLGLTCMAIGMPLLMYGVLARVGINETVGPYFFFTEHLPLRNLTFRIGCATLSIAVLAGLHLLHPRLSLATRGWVEPVGRMALTNYLAQSIAFVFMFHVVAPARFDTLDHDEMLALVLLAWIAQIVVSRLWLHHFKQGPIEYLWRRFAGKKSRAGDLSPLGKLQ